MGAEVQSVPAAAKLFNQANDILGYLQPSDSTCVFFFWLGVGFSLSLLHLVYYIKIAWAVTFQENEV
jgi:hypothetical protein